MTIHYIITTWTLRDDLAMHVYGHFATGQFYSGNRLLDDSPFPIHDIATGQSLERPHHYSMICQHQPTQRGTISIQRKFYFSAIV